MATELPWFDDEQILAARPSKNIVQFDRPYAYIVEPERTAAGRVEDVATLFLSNPECPFRCLMCDLWQNTTDIKLPAGAIPSQIDYALARLPTAEHIKLYNSGNFFDPRAIVRGDWPAIAERVRGFKTVIVENHPNLVSPRCKEFKESIAGRLEIAMGLETTHPDVLPRLNKRMTLTDFARATEHLLADDIDVRAFILVKPPFLSEGEGIEWAIRSMKFAFSLGVGCCALIPTRAGNGIMDALQSQGHFAPPVALSLELVLEAGIGLNRGRVLLDLWDIERSLPCESCRSARKARLLQMNLTQQLTPPIVCECEG
jgi:radical SAM enzyme (TIGR01210 family)